MTQPPFPGPDQPTPPWQPSDSGQPSAMSAFGEPRRHTRRGWLSRPGTKLALGAMASFGIGLLVSFVHFPYAILMPGPVTDVLGTFAASDGSSTPRIQIKDAQTYPTSGSLDFTTVRVAGGPGYPVTVVDLVTAWIDPTKDVRPVDEIFPPNATKEQVAEENRVEMAGSQQEATAVALRALGYTLTPVISIASLAPDAPSKGELKVGDVLVSVGGAPANDGAAVRAAVQKATPGDTVEVVVKRDGATLTTHPKTGKAADGRTILGVVLQGGYTLPFPVTIDAGNVGGPSAGLMFSLGVYDKLTDGALTGGKSIAGTGTIDDSGAVGPIGGIRQKIVGAERAGATFFLAPKDNCTEVAGFDHPGIQVVKVATFQDAKTALEGIAKGETAALPSCDATP